MSEGLAIGSGLARGLSNVLLSQRQRDQEDQVRKEAQVQQVKMSILSRELENGGDPNVLIPALGIDLHFGEKPPKGQPNHNDILQQLLQPHAQQVQGLQPAIPAAANPEPQVGPPEDVLPSRALVSPATPPKPTVPGQIPFTSPEEVAQRKIATETALDTAKLNAQAEAKLSLAKRLRVADPTMSLEDSLVAVGLKVPQDEYGTAPSGSFVYKKRGEGAGTITEPGSAKAAGNMPGALGERTRELKALHPEWDDAKAQSEAATSIASEREGDRAQKEANLESIKANREIRNTLLHMQENLGGITPNNAAGLTTQLRTAWNKAVQPFKERQTYVGKLNEMITPDANGKTGIQRDRNVATQTIINSFNRLLEEQNTVREGEYARSEELAPLGTKLQAFVTALQSGGGKLTDAQLTSIAKEGIKIANVTADVYGSGLSDIRKAMTTQLSRYNLPPEDVFGNSKLGGGTFSTTLGAKTYTFDSQAKLDAFKRQYPDAK